MSALRRTGLAVLLGLCLSGLASRAAAPPALGLDPVPQRRLDRLNALFAREASAGRFEEAVKRLEEKLRFLRPAPYQAGKRQGSPKRKF
jgi:hypothetical protein